MPLAHYSKQKKELKTCESAVCNVQGHKSWQQNMSRRWEEKLHERDEETT
ncbi:hypothetical protein GBA52_022325 [Prunus armeniaca]|nr:hypothetical protein GBA52_022325 [Prunus armeniaca]